MGKYSKEEKQKILDAYAEEGISIPQFCAKHEISPSTLRGWLTTDSGDATKKRSKEDQATEAAAAPQYKEGQMVVFKRSKGGQFVQPFAPHVRVSEKVVVRLVPNRRFKAPYGKRMQRLVDEHKIHILGIVEE